MAIPVRVAAPVIALIEMLMQQKNILPLLKLIHDWGNCSQFHQNCCAGGKTAFTPGGTCLLRCVQPAHAAKTLGSIPSWRGDARLCKGAGGWRGHLTTFCILDMCFKLHCVWGCFGVCLFGFGGLVFLLFFLVGCFFHFQQKFLTYF